MLEQLSIKLVVRFEPMGFVAKLIGTIRSMIAFSVSDVACATACTSEVRGVRISGWDLPAKSFVMLPARLRAKTAMECYKGHHVNR